MVDKMTLDISPTTAKALASICKIYMIECEEMYPKYQAMDTAQCKEFGAWLQLAALWFKLVALWTTYQINQFIVTGMMDKSKGIAKVYLENKILADSLIRLKEIAKNMKKQNKKYQEFKFADNAQYIHDFISPTLVDQLKEGATKFGHVKDSLNLQGLEGHNEKAILDEIDGSNNLIEMIIRKQSGI